VAPRAGCVVVHYGEAEPTRACVAAIVADPSPVERVIVVVDNSGDLPEDAVAPARVLRCPDNPGFGAGANRGVAALGGGAWDAFVVLNHDVQVCGGFLASACRSLTAPGVGAAGGPVYLDEGRTRFWYAGGRVSLVTGTVRQSRSPRAAARARDVSFVPGAALAISPAAWAAVGGFDPGIFLYNEDVELCLRLRRHGFRLRFEPGMAAIHDLGAATGSQRRSALYLEHISRTRLRPFRPLALRLHLAALHTVYVTLRAAWHAVQGASGRDEARALVRGHVEALKAIGRSPRP
jgi:hypothetical protein